MKYLKRLIYSLVFFSLLSIGFEFVYQKVTVKPIHEDVRFYSLLNQFEQDMIRFKQDPKRLRDIKVVKNVSPWTTHFQIASCSNNTLYYSSKLLAYPEQTQKRIFYHELGHCLFNYAHNHVGIMSYKGFYKRMNDFELYSFFNQRGQNYLDMFKSMNPLEILLINSKMLHRNINSKDTWDNFYSTYKKGLEDLFIYLLIFSFLIIELVSIIKMIVEYHKSKKAKEYQEIQN